MTTKIVIIDDEPNIIISLEFLFHREGFNVASAPDGESGLALVRRECPAILILDVMMPKLNGYEVCQAIRRDPHLARTRIVILSAKGRDDEVQEGISAGADCYLTKPFSTQELLKTIRQLMVSDLPRARNS